MQFSRYFSYLFSSGPDTLLSTLFLNNLPLCYACMVRDHAHIKQCKIVVSIDETTDNYGTVFLMHVFR
jgi:hypothetical protein